MHENKQAKLRKVAKAPANGMEQFGGHLEQEGQKKKCGWMDRWAM
jgi:hypothetical protein